jgi:hypothetical protein
LVVHDIHAQDNQNVFVSALVRFLLAQKRTKKGHHDHQILRFLAHMAIPAGPKLLNFALIVDSHRTASSIISCLLGSGLSLVLLRGAFLVRLA